MSDLWAPATVFLISTFATLAWIHYFSQLRVSRSFTNTTRIVMRLAIAIGMSYWLLRMVFGIPVLAYAIGSVVVLLMSIAATHEGVAAGNAFDFALGNAVLLPCYVLKQLILGFPDREILIPSAPPDAPRPDLSVLVGCQGYVIASLKPCGAAKINEIEYGATSLNGTYVDVGTPIRVVGTLNTLLIVDVTESRSDSIL